jgi:anti-sigma-K factor RskA
MTPEDEDLPERGRDDLLAAEYVLGVLDRAEREAAARRIESEPAFARAVDGWEANLAPLAGAYGTVEPPALIKTAIDRRLFGSAAASGADTRPSASWWSSLAVWRSLTVAALAAFAVAVAIPFIDPPTPEGETRYMATLTADASDVRYAAVYDQNVGEVALAHMSGAKAADRDFELWMIEGSNAPVSMGVLPAGDVIKIAIPPDVRAKLAAGAVLAISLEPLGGSPTGQPTGPVVAAGDLKSI